MFNKSPQMIFQLAVHFHVVRIPRYRFKEEDIILEG